jgi:hypothetical protein
MDLLIIIIPVLMICLLLIYLIYKFILIKKGKSTLFDSEDPNLVHRNLVNPQLNTINTTEDKNEAKKKLKKTEEKKPEDKKPEDKKPEEKVEENENPIAKNEKKKKEKFTFTLKYFLEDKSISSLLDLLKLNKFIIDLSLLDKEYDSKKDFMELLKKLISTLLNDKYLYLKSELSKLRRKGLDINDLDMRLMSVPLKIKVFISSFTDKDLNSLIVIINEIETDILNLKKKNNID